ncbi:exonuclease domain-containing protein [Dictyobacter aurantiacus]|uniref:Exonuclease domain-containing protein n=1 Tax=Dictyobacter aurantiacus TaxID=1936993 RepID=A0A401ZH14_9CHLR|nr:exonuclease domain-containing protein [Dictyobacter aurantiacus]GCE06149.1 hypothetical protein KDAU_34780 [Dictyobacter aurantiacus]
MELNVDIQGIRTLIDQEAVRGSVKNVDDLHCRLSYRSGIESQLECVESEIRKLRRAAQQLPKLPPLSIVRWAQAVQLMPNLVFLELDTTGLYEDAEIIRAVVLDKDGVSLLDLYAQPSKPIAPSIEHFTGIDASHLAAHATRIEDVLAQLEATLKGKYVLSYNLDFDTGKLSEATARLNREPISIIGADMMHYATSYYAASTYLKLETVCQRIGSPLPQHPHQTALDRGKGQIALLNAMANAITDMKADPPDTDDDSSDLDEHPF